MAKHSVITRCNVQGLGDGVKWLTVFHMVKQLGSSLLCLQETHMSPTQASPFSTHAFGHLFPLYFLLLFQRG